MARPSWAFGDERGRGREEELGVTGVNRPNTKFWFWGWKHTTPPSLTAQHKRLIPRYLDTLRADPAPRCMLSRWLGDCKMMCMGSWHKELSLYRCLI